MNITATHINYYHICHRKLWLFSNGITLEHTSDLVAEGKLIGEHSYPQRAEKPKRPSLLNSSICKRCSYYEFCYASE
ncbi:Dna2/Cas4 domain-containing protein [Chitinophaga sp. CF418]|uniref:Dna2/Cas4 domain-containing protein n=1 Tax=Chitinophaga sp. CF418 TaxID=1855287 RepID=UPI00122C7A9F|nr:Dna2/Cas4 domain-containing protein [Chitinophaga sp. CF418]